MADVQLTEYRWCARCERVFVATVTVSPGEKGTSVGLGHTRRPP
jgi:hypothetical protein